MQDESSILRNGKSGKTWLEGRPDHHSCHAVRKRACLLLWTDLTMLLMWTDLTMADLTMADLSILLLWTTVVSGLYLCATELQ